MCTETSQMTTNVPGGSPGYREVFSENDRILMIERSANLMLSAAAIRVARAEGRGRGNVAEGRKKFSDVEFDIKLVAKAGEYLLVMRVGDMTRGTANMCIEFDSPVREIFVLVGELCASSCERQAASLSLTQISQWNEASPVLSPATQDSSDVNVCRFGVLVKNGLPGRLYRVQDKDSSLRQHGRKYTLESIVTIPLQVEDARKIGRGRLMYTLYSVWMKAIALGVDVALTPSAALALALKRERAGMTTSAYPICLWRSWELCLQTQAHIQTIATRMEVAKPNVGGICWYDCKIDVQPLSEDVISRLPDSERITYVSMSHNFREVSATPMERLLTEVDFAKYGLKMRDVEEKGGEPPRVCAGPTCCGKILKKLILPHQHCLDSWGPGHEPHNSLIIRSISVHFRWDHKDYNLSSSMWLMPDDALIKVRPMVVAIALMTLLFSATSTCVVILPRAQRQ